MDSEDQVRILSVDTMNLDYDGWWCNIWRVHEFESWADAICWLWDRYRAEVHKTDQGFDISFLHLDDAILFRLT